MNFAQKLTSMDRELKSRVGTAAIGVSVLLVLIIFGGTIGTAVVATVISLGMVFEFVEMTFSLPDKREKKFILLGATWLIAFFSILFPRGEYALLVFSLLALFSYFLFTAERYSEPELFTEHFKELMYSLFGVFYLAFFPLFLPAIRGAESGLHWTLIFLFVNWAGDTAAYFVGKKYGRQKLYPVISPKKTVEGAYGGLAAGLVVTLIYKVLFFRSMSWGAVILVPIIIGAVAQVGDLCESFLKRAFRKKDSGSILPGHGGFLDRFDGVLFSLPVMYACVRIFG